MAEVVGIDHIYIAVSDRAASERFYGQVMIEAQGFCESKFSISILLPTLRFRATAGALHGEARCRI
jgi:hypothetical protein